MLFRSVELLATAEVVVIAPSNPIVSIGAILAVPGMRAAVEAARDRTVAVSPIVGGRALKGPADRLLASLGHEPSVVGVARLYRDLAAVLVIDEVDTLVPAQSAANSEWIESRIRGITPRGNTAIYGGVSQGAAGPREFRTTPLWGVGLVQVVAPSATFLHDGRARTLAEAILWHGGEAAAAQAAFRAAAKADRDALIGFLQTL